MRLGALLAASLLLGALPMRAGAVNSALFSPYTATATGSWSEAVQIGDVNGDGLADVVLTTSYYFDPAHDFKLYVFLQQPDGQLAAPVVYPTNSTVTLDGAASHDLDGTIVSYQWRQVSGYAVALSNASSARASISIPRSISPLPNALVFELTVTDDAGGTASDTVTVTVNR